VSAEFMIDEMFSEDGFGDLTSTEYAIPRAGLCYLVTDPALADSFDTGGPQKIDERNIADQNFYNEFDDDFDDDDL